MYHPRDGGAPGRSKSNDLLYLLYCVLAANHSPSHKKLAKNRAGGKRQKWLRGLCQVG